MRVILLPVVSCCPLLGHTGVLRFDCNALPVCLCGSAVIRRYLTFRRKKKKRSCERRPGRVFSGSVPLPPRSSSSCRPEEEERELPEEGRLGYSGGQSATAVLRTLGGRSSARISSAVRLHAVYLKHTSVCVQQYSYEYDIWHVSSVAVCMGNGWAAACLHLYAWHPSYQMLVHSVLFLRFFFVFSRPVLVHAYIRVLR